MNPNPHSESWTRHWLSCFAAVQVLQESLSIPGTDVYLVYRSSQTSGYMSTILIQLTPDDIPQQLVAVHLRVIVEGLVFERLFEADPGLRYRFTWDRRNAYNQKVYGIVTASGEMTGSASSIKTHCFLHLTLTDHSAAVAIVTFATLWRPINSGIIISLFL